MRENFAWTLGGTLVYSACQWGMLVALAKMGNPEIVGTFALALAITAPIMIGSGLSLRSVQVTDVRRDHPFGDYLLLRAMTTFVSVLAIVAIATLAGYSWSVACVIMMVGAAKAFESMSDIVHGLLQRHERMDRIALSLVIKGPLSLAVLAGGLVFWKSLLVGVFGMAAVWALMLLCFDIPNGAAILSAAHSAGNASPLKSLRSLFELRWNPGALGSLTWLALPFGVVMGLISLNANIPRYYIEHELGIAALGIFAAMAYPVIAGGLVVGAMGQSALPRLARYYAANDRAGFIHLLLKLQVLVLAPGIIGVLAIAFAGRPILTLLYRSEYANYVNAFLWLGIGAIISNAASLFGYAMTAARHFRSQLPVFVVVTLATAIGCAWLIPRYHMTGAAIALALAAACQAAGGAGVTFYALRKREEA